MNSRTRNVLGACLTVSILAGLSSFPSTKQANAAVITHIVGEGIGQGLKCGSGSSAQILDKIIIDLRSSISFDTTKDFADIFARVNSVDVIGGVGADVVFKIHGQIFLPRGYCGNDNFVLTGKCHVGAPRETVTYTSSDNRGTWDVLYSECDVALGSGNPPPNSGACITGTDKNDNLIGTSSNDCIDAKGGNDKIAGHAGNDKLNGGDGNDLLSGGTGNDILTGGKGADSFQCGAGNDKITDFKASEGDKKTNDCEQF